MRPLTDDDARIAPAPQPGLRTGRSRGGTRPCAAAAAAAALLVLQACSTPPPATAPGAAPPASIPTPAPTPAAAAERRIAALAVERRWLQSWFKDTPVLIAARGDTAISVEVPREFCFDTGTSTVKPALAAVLDKVAESLRRHRQARLELLAAPADGSVASQLALLRAAQVRAHLASRGVPAARLAPPSATSAASVQLRLAVAGPTEP